MTDWWERVFLTVLPSLTSTDAAVPAVKAVGRAAEYANAAVIYLAMQADITPAAPAWTSATATGCADGYKQHRWTVGGICERCGYTQSNLRARAKSYRKLRRKQAA